MRLEGLSCRRRVALLMDYLDRELPRSQRKVLSGHFARCRDCATLLKHLEFTVEALRASKNAAKPAPAARRLLRSRLAGR